MLKAVEIVGGTTRVRCVKAAVSRAVYGERDDAPKLQTTLNADECVSRGCALAAAFLSSPVVGRTIFFFFFFTEIPARASAHTHNHDRKAMLRAPCCARFPFWATMVWKLI